MQGTLDCPEFHYPYTSVRMRQSLQRRGPIVKLLIVEDSGLVAERLKELVREVPGYEIAGTAADVGGTWRLVPQLNPDVIVLDLQIPGGSGLDVLRAVKSGQRHVFVIVLTNQASAPVREACLSAGADFFLDKSTEFGQLPAVLARIGRESGHLRRRRFEPEEPIRKKATA
jgi:DNA-binding NarL/FixJ family response regulator